MTAATCRGRSRRTWPRSWLAGRAVTSPFASTSNRTTLSSKRSRRRSSPGSCVGFLRAGQTVCTTDAAPGAIVFLRAEDETYRYHVLESGGIRAVDFEDGRVTQEPNADYVTVQQAMREDLADHLNADASEISMRSFREVTWADGCMGVRRPDVVCTPGAGRWLPRGAGGQRWQGLPLPRRRHRFHRHRLRAECHDRPATPARRLSGQRSVMSAIG